MGQSFYKEPLSEHCKNDCRDHDNSCESCHIGPKYLRFTIRCIRQHNWCRFRIFLGKHQRKQKFIPRKYECEQCCCGYAGTSQRQQYPEYTSNSRSSITQSRAFRLCWRIGKVEESRLQGASIEMPVLPIGPCFVPENVAGTRRMQPWCRPIPR